MNISFIGYGKIAKALTTGLLRAGQYHIRAAAPSLPSGVNPQGVETSPHNLPVLADADIILLAVKPAHMASVMAEIKPALPSDCLLISVATGLNLAWFTLNAAPKTAIVRAMPNIAASVGKSATPLIANQSVHEHQKARAQALFNAMGISAWIQNENEMDTFTALSGSGPAYVFQFIQSMIGAAVEMGLENSIATAFALETVSGAVALATEGKKSLLTLTEEVTSKGGTTAAALGVLEKHHFSEIIAEAMKAAQRRAHELSCSILNP